MVIQTVSVTILGMASALLHGAGIQPSTAISHVPPQDLCPHVSSIILYVKCSCSMIFCLFVRSCTPDAFAHCQIPWIPKADNWENLTLQMRKSHLPAMPYIPELLLELAHLYVLFFPQRFYQELKCLTLSLKAQPASSCSIASCFHSN